MLLLGNFCKCAAWRNNARVYRPDDSVPVMARQKLNGRKERSFVTRNLSTHAASVCTVLFVCAFLLFIGILMCDLNTTGTDVNTTGTDVKFAVN